MRLDGLRFLRVSWWLILVGGIAELVGVVFIASPELWPRFVSAATRSREWAKAVAGWMSTNARRLLHRRSEFKVDANGVNFHFEMPSAEVSVHRRLSPDSSVGRIARFLLEEHDKQVDRFARIEAELESQPERWRQDIEKARSEIGAKTREALERELKNVRDSHINWRISGVVILLVGIALVTAGNLV